MPLQLLQADITTLRADAIVCAANNYLLYDRFGASGALMHAADTKRLERACRQIGYCKTGDAVVTPSFGLPCTHLIHTVGPVWKGGSHGEEALLRSCYTRSLDLAEKLGLRSVAFPLIASGVRGYPRAYAIAAATSAIGDWLMAHDTDMLVLLTLFREPSSERYREIYSYIEQAAPDLKSSLYPPVKENINASPFGLNAPELSRLFSKTSSVFKKSLPNSDPSTEEDDLSAPSEAPEAAADLEDAEEAYFSPAPSDFDAILSDISSDCHEQVHRVYESVSPADLPSAVCSRPEDRIAFDFDDSERIRRRLQDLMRQKQETFRDMLLRLIDERRLNDPEVYKRANLDRRLFSKIRSNPDYQPTKNTVLALSIALRLNLDQTIDLLRLAGFALSPNNKSDLIIQYFINMKIYDIHAINEMLFEFNLKLLGTQTIETYSA